MLPLVCMVWWVHRRSRFGGNASAVLRSAYPIILSVGGWLLGALIVLATMPSVPVDDELLVALSVSLPVGLGDLPGLGTPGLGRARRRASGSRPQSMERS